jgi:threonine dehydrogenase-like Zn-dependent dehydrogenase
MPKSPPRACGPNASVPARSAARDMCRNGRYTEHGIKELDGFAAARYVLDASAAVRVPAALGDQGVLVEPASIVAKAWEQIEAIGRRALWAPRRVLVTGADPIGLLAALMATQRDLEVHVLDVVTSGPKPRLVEALGATYHSSCVDETCPDVDVVIECTGVGEVVLDAMRATGPSASWATPGSHRGSERCRCKPPP